MDEDKEEFTSSGPQYDIEKLSSATAEQLSIKVEDQDVSLTYLGRSKESISPYSVHVSYSTNN